MSGKKHYPNQGRVGANPESMEIPIRPDQIETVECATCKSRLFMPIAMIGRVNGLVVGSPVDQFMTRFVDGLYKCVTCGKILNLEQLLKQQSEDSKGASGLIVPDSFDKSASDQPEGAPAVQEVGEVPINNVTDQPVEEVKESSEPQPAPEATQPVEEASEPFEPRGNDPTVEEVVDGAAEPPKGGSEEKEQGVE